MFCIPSYFTCWVVASIFQDYTCHGLHAIHILCTFKHIRSFMSRPSKLVVLVVAWQGVSHNSQNKLPAVTATERGSGASGADEGPAVFPQEALETRRITDSAVHLDEGRKRRGKPLSSK